MPAATHLIVTHLQELDLFPIPLAFLNGGTTIPLLSGWDQTTSDLVMDVLLQTVRLCKKEACYPPIRLYFTNLGDGGKSPICP